MSTTPSMNEFDKLEHEIEERKKKKKREMEDLDRNLDLLKKLKADQEKAAQLYESGLRELQKAMFKAEAQADSELTDSPISLSNKEKAKMKAKADLEPRKVKEEELKPTTSPIPFSNKVDHSRTKDADDCGSSQRKQKFQCKSPEDGGSNYLLNRRCDLKIITYIKNNLHKEDLESFRQSCFGQFLKLNELEYQGHVVLHLLLHIDMDASNKEKLVFKINNSNIEFGPREFSQITGLRFCTLDETITTPSSSSIHEKIFKGSHRITPKDVKEAFISHEGKGEFKLKLTLLYFLYGTLLATSPDKRIEMQYLHLVEDLQKFNEFPWGEVVYKFLVSFILSLRERIDHGLVVVTNRKTQLSLNGFSFVLQIWAYEVMPSLAEYCASRVKNWENLTPWILRWYTPKKAAFFNDLKKFFTPGDAAQAAKLEHEKMDGIPQPKKGKLISKKDQKSSAMCSSSAAGEINIIIIDCDDDDDETPDMQTNNSKRDRGETIKMEKRCKLSGALDSQCTDSDDDASCSTASTRKEATVGLRICMLESLFGKVQRQNGLQILEFWKEKKHKIGW